jgi:putative ABC transport system permease protein
LKSALALTAMSLSSLPKRLGTASVVVLAIAGVVAVLVAVLGMSTGIARSIAGTGRNDRAMVLRAGAGRELPSLITRTEATTIIAAAGVQRSADGKPIASAEALTLVELRLADGTPTNVPLRGVSRTEVLRPEIKIIEGRMFRPGVRELIVGSAARSQFPNLHVGGSITSREAQWEIVGTFASDGTLHDSELLCDAESLLAAYQRQVFQSVLVQLTSASALPQFKAALSADPTLQVDVFSESAYYAKLAKPLSDAFSIVAYIVGGIMAAGAVFAALSSVYAAVSQRAREIATLRAIGFGVVAVVTAVMLETLLLAVIGGSFGAILCRFGLGGRSLSTTGGGIVQLTYEMAVTWSVIGIGLGWACSIGLLAGLFPALREARRPITAGLRAI